MQGLLQRLKHVRTLALPRDFGEAIHPARLAKFAREGAVAPLTLLNDFGERRRVAALAAQMSELETTLTDAAIALFERLTAQLFTRSTRTRDQSWSASKAQAGRLIRLFGATIDAMVRAREQARDPFDVLDEAVGWDRLIASRDEIDTLGDLATEDPLSLAATRYIQLRRFAPAFLEAFEFDAPVAGRSLQAAVELLRELSRSGKRKLPDIVPMPFANKQWRSLVADNAKTARRFYETAVVSTLRDRLRAGDVWVEGSRDYRRFDAYLPPADDARRVLVESGVETEASVWLVDRRERLHERLGEVGAKLARGRLDGVRLENARVRITPYDAVTPPAGERLDRAIDVLMPRIRITDLLWEVNSRTGFLDAFTDLRSGRVHSNRAAILAAVLAGATNLGLERMAHASSGVSHAQLSWAHAWYLRPETYADALARIIDAHHALPFAHVWGSPGTTSSDGQFFPSGRNAGEINAKYGPERALEARLFPSVEVSARVERAIPDWAQVHTERRRPGVTLALLWEEYKAEHPQGLQYSQFCERYRVWRGRIDVVMRQTHRAGEKLFVDYAGQCVAVVDPITGELRNAQIFVAVLGASNYTFAEATWTQALPDWCASHVRALSFFNGVPEIVVPDNLKSAITRPHRYEPDAHPTYTDLAEHYGFAILPARVRRPRDKSLVS